MYGTHSMFLQYVFFKIIKYHIFNLFKSIYVNLCVRYAVLTAVCMKSDIFWNVIYSLVEVSRRLGGMYCLHFQALIVRVFS
jgi:hypothetical protein